jgi:hypothetical protein
MSTTTNSYPKIISSRRALLIGVIILVCVALAAGYIWLITDQNIVPPSLRIMDFFWRALHWSGI